MKLLVTALLIVSSFFGLAATATTKAKAEDFQKLTGPQWSGTLTYTDYGTGKKVSIRSNLVVTRSTAGGLSWTFAYQYPDEPNASSNSTVTISKDGASIDGERVIERTRLAKGIVRIVTEKTGTDNDKNASIHLTYTLGGSSFSIKKEVRYEGETESFERNLYSWKRTL